MKKQTPAPTIPDLLRSIEEIQKRLDDRLANIEKKVDGLLVQPEIPGEPYLGKAVELAGPDHVYGWWDQKATELKLKNWFPGTKGLKGKKGHVISTFTHDWMPDLTVLVVRLVPDGREILTDPKGVKILEARTMPKEAK